MKKSILAFPALILAFLMVSCPDEGGGGSSGYPSREFWAQDMSTDAFYRVEAVKLAEGSRCIIWAESSAGVSEEIAEAMAWEYDNVIYQKMMDVFGATEDFKDGGIVVARNTLELADWLGDNDGKLAILLLDIKDGYAKPGDRYVGGYFWLGNFYRTADYSNRMDMMYVDTYPNRPGSLKSNVFFAHELQHLMNFATSTRKRLVPMDTWINEGLSAAAEYIYRAPDHYEDRINFFAQDLAGTIVKGNNFFVWGNHSTPPTDNPLSILDDYATVYLFFQWLRLQSSNGTGIYRDIVTSPYSDHRAVTAAAAAKIDGSYSDWGALLRDWMAANYLMDTGSRYGYKNDPTIQGKLAGAKKKYLTGNIASLYPGEGVYSYSDGTSSTPSSGDNIRYTGLESSGLISGTISAGGALLTYNASTALRKYISNPPELAETGTLTGVKPPPSASINYTPGAAMSRSVQSLPSSYAIDARDMLRRNGQAGWESPGFGDLALPGVETDAAE
jgi:hypothetical protein